MDYQLQGKVALVSGCSQGLGYQCVLALIGEGVKVFGVSIGDDSQLKDEVKRLKGEYHSLTLSLTTPGAIRNCVKEVLAVYHKIDILLNFAGTLKKQDTLAIHKEEWLQAFDINVNVAFFLAQEVIKIFQKQKTGGKIINASGVLPLEMQEYCAYYTSKGAMEAMSKYLAHEFGKDQIQVNAISFGFMDCGSKLQNTHEFDEAALIERIPAGRWGNREDLDGLLLLLASDCGNYINGSIIPLDGGYSIHN